MIVTLPWPASKLFPNRKAHWTVVYRLRAAAKQTAWALCLEAGARDMKPALVLFAFHPPSRRKVDVDNTIAAIKGHVDGLAQALGVDDSLIPMRFPETLSEPVPGGAIRVEIIAA